MTLKLKPFVSAGEAFKLPDGSVTNLPLQVIAFEDGHYAIRLGDTRYFFDEDGAYDGPEMHFKSQNEAIPAREALDLGTQNRGKQPERSYFTPGSKGHDAEMAPFRRH